MNEKILRSRAKSLRATDENGAHVVSGVIPYNSVSAEMWVGYCEASREKLQAGCFADWISNNDVYANYAHDETLILGNTKSETLKLEDKDDGLHFLLTLGESDVAKRCFDTIKRGDCETLSFEFYPREWTIENDICILQKADLTAISLCVINPAYPETESQTIRSKRSTMDEQKIDELIKSLSDLTAKVDTLTEKVNAMAEQERDGEDEQTQELEEKEQELEELEEELKELEEEEAAEEERDDEEEEEEERDGEEKEKKEEE
jgi:hypothetical protein